MYRWLTDLHEIARSANLRVSEIEGWKDRGRPATVGGFDPGGICCHHTGSTADGIDYARWLALTGRPEEGIPAPLAQLALNRDGIVYVLAAGRANGAGTIDADELRPWTPDDDGNTWTLSIEAMNTGAEGWTDDQHDAYVRLCAALCDAYGWTADRVVGHKELAPSRKVDPGKLDMDRFRRAIARQLTTEEPMPIPDPQPNTWQRKIRRLDDHDPDGPDELPAGVMLAQTHHRADAARTRATDAEATAADGAQAAREARAAARSADDHASSAAKAADAARLTADHAGANAAVAARRAGQIIELLGGRWVLEPPTDDNASHRSLSERGLGVIKAPDGQQSAPVTSIFPPQDLDVPVSSGQSMRPGEYRKATGAAAAAGLVGVLGGLAQAWTSGGLDHPDAQQVSTWAATVVTLLAGTFGVTFARANRSPAEIDARKAARKRKRHR